MDAAAVSVVLFPNCGLLFPTFSASTKLKLGKSNFLGKEVADGTSLLNSRRKLLPSPLWIIRSEGDRRGRPPRGNTSSDNTVRQDTNENISQSSSGESPNSSNQEEIIALFRRIQSSISKDGSIRTKKSSSDNSNKKQSSASVSRVLRQRRKSIKAKVSNQDKVLPRRRGAPIEEERTGDNSSRIDIKLTRPPSNFVKRSPIPTPSTLEREVGDVIGEGFPAAVDGKELRAIEKMKLPELKELAKSRGIKGYSKLKKGELVELLKWVS
ncbi:Rho termination factor [Macleaya cordata]|uniref:Rho termination factor n=1 Tax=Macleaya cordata TaxID=56857 RepID=A0A200QXF1_MACCD|nr:Rho termination factor [Macleaya cordata]